MKETVVFPSDSVQRKFRESFSIDDLEIETDSGWVDLDFIHKTIPYLKFRVEVESGLFIECADDHIVFDHEMNEVFVKDLIPFESAIITKNGIEEVTLLECLNVEEEMYDVSVYSNGQRFFSGGILSHNSSIHTALTYCLFGKTTRNVNLTQLINSVNEKDCLVEVEFDCYNDEYLIRRGLKPATFDIVKNGILINPDSRTKDYQRYFEENILRTDFRTFTSVITIGGRDYTPFMKQPKAERRRIIESLLNIDVFSLMNQLAKSKSQELQDLIKEKKQDIKLLSSEISFIKDSIEKTKNLINKNKDNNQEKINHYRDKLDKLSSSLSSLEEEIVSITSTFGDIEKLDSVYRAKREKMVYLKNQNGKKKDSISKEKKFYLEVDSCPTCSQTIDSSIKTFHLQRLESSSTDIQKHLDFIESSLGELDVLHSEIKSNLKVYNTLLNNKSSLLQESSSLLSIISELEKMSSSLSSNLDTTLEEEKLNLKIEELNRERSSLESLIEETEYFDFCQLLLKDDGVKTLIIKEYLPKINTILNKFLEQLDLFIDFQFDENFKESIKSRHRDSFSYESFSDGQKMKIDLALLFTWREIARIKNSLNTNVLFCDEIADSSLDPSSTELVIRLLDKIALDTSTFIISHKSELFESKMDRILSLSLENNFTSIEEII